MNLEKQGDDIRQVLAIYSCACNGGWNVEFLIGYRSLYQAREGESEQEEWTTMIENKVKDIETENNNNLDTEPNLITRDELDMAIRQLNKGKSVGPDDIPNEAIINMNKKNRHAQTETQ